jgi:hypothetical protein
MSYHDTAVPSSFFTSSGIVNSNSKGSANLASHNLAPSSLPRTAAGLSVDSSSYGPRTHEKADGNDAADAFHPTGFCTCHDDLSKKKYMGGFCHCFGDLQGKMVRLEAAKNKGMDGQQEGGRQFIESDESELQRITPDMDMRPNVVAANSEGAKQSLVVTLKYNKDQPPKLDTKASGDDTAMQDNAETSKTKASQTRQSKIVTLKYNKDKLAKLEATKSQDDDVNIEGETKVEAGTGPNAASSES